MRTIVERAKEYASKKADISLSAIYNEALARIYEEGYMVGAQEQPCLLLTLRGGSWRRRKDRKNIIYQPLSEE